MKFTDLDALARTLYGEAEVGDIDDAEAIASVILNRVAYPNWPNDVLGVCTQPWQFSCWNAGDPQRARMLAVSQADAWFARCHAIAHRAMSGNLDDKTNGATHYYATYIATPKWARGKVPSYVNTYGRYQHRFFNDIDTPPPASAAQALDQSRPIGTTRTVKGAQVALGGGAMAAGALELAGQAQGALPLLRTLSEWSPWLVLAIAALGIGYMVWARIDDRRAGVR